MSLKTTNKEARAAVRQYILDHFNPCGYEFSGPCTFENVARFILDTCYFYNRSAVADLGAILQQSERERARYTESQAEQLLTHLIYQELVKGARK